MCEAGLHITLGVGLRLFNLLEYDLQQLDLQLLVQLQESTDTPVGLVALLKDAQLCEIEAEDALERMQQHQTLYDWISTNEEHEVLHDNLCCKNHV